jgi:hypothetical protein
MQWNFLMSYKVTTIPHFDKAIKRLVKKFPSQKMEYLALIESLSINPKQGKDLGSNCYKIRLAIKSKGVGKSGGARVITYLKVIDEKIVLLDIYDKSEQNNIDDKEIEDLIKNIE